MSTIGLLPLMLTNLVAYLAQRTRGLPRGGDQGLTGEGDSGDVGVRLPESIRPILLTLHLLYPHVVLDALDLIDRGCVVRLRIGNEIARSDGTQPAQRGGVPQTENEQSPNSLTQQRRDILNEMAIADCIDSEMVDDDGSSGFDTSSKEPSVPSLPTYYVRSAQPGQSRSSAAQIFSEPPHAQTKGYVIHLAAWNCSCPAFAYATFVGDGKPSHDAQVRLSSLMSSDDGTIFQSRDEREVPPSIMRELPDALTRGFGGLQYFTFLKSSPDTGLTRPSVLKVKQERCQTLPACCKHLMACVLAEAMPAVFHVLRNMRDAHSHEASTAGSVPSDIKGVVERWVDVEEAAGWAAGAAFGL